MRAALSLAAALLLTGCSGKTLDVRLCLSEDAPKRPLGTAIRHRYYAEHLPPFRRVHLMPSGGLTRMCDVIAVLNSSGAVSGHYSAAVVSAYSKKSLFSAQASGSLEDAAKSMGDQLYAAFDRGTALHEQVAAERKGK